MNLGLDLRVFRNGCTFALLGLVLEGEEGALAKCDYRIFVVCVVGTEWLYF